MTMELCQCCMTDEGLVTALGELQSLVAACFSIQFMGEKTYEEIPCYVCDRCIGRLKDSYSFKCQIEDTQLKLKDAYLKTDLNEEVQVEYCTDDDEIIKTEYLSDDDSQSNFASFEVPLIEDIEHKSVFKKRNRRSRSKRNGTKDDSNDDSSLLIERPNSGSSKKKTKRPKDMSQEETAHYKRMCNRYRYAKAIPFKLDESAVSCNLCSETFSTHKFLVSHMATHYPNHICDLCGKSFVLKTHLLGHIRTHDSEKVSCSVCNKLLKKSSMTRHLRTHSGNNEVYACPHCSERFVSFSTRVNHMAKMHNVDIFKYHCKICSKKFHLSNSLSKHVRRCHFQELNATCEECGKGFFDKKSLSEHMLKHTGEKNFQCKICLKTYARKCTLREHVKIHDNLKKSHQCTTCDKIFTQKGSLKAHIWKVHQSPKQLLTL